MARMDLSTLDEITRRLADAMPADWKRAGENLEARIRPVLEAQLARLELVTREEFEIQKRVLERAWEKLERLEQQLDDAGRSADGGSEGDSDGEPAE
jgi:hypothetical protein